MKSSIVFQTSSPNVLKNKFALAGLLTYSTFSAFPSAYREQWHCGEKAFFMSLQLREQLRTRTGFPFHLHLTTVRFTRTNYAANV